MAKKLRKGTAKYLLQNSVESVLTAVEIYNKPKTQFKVQSFITLMIIGWTKVLHSYFHSEGIKYFYKGKDGNFEKIDGEYKSWDITKCIKEYKKFDEAVKSNLLFFIGLRNKVEHRDLTDTDIDMITFGECQSFLYNYETFLVEEFGEEYSINENLVFALQFSTYNTLEQKKSQKRQLSKELIDIKHYIDKYKSSLSDEIYDSQKYSIKFLIIPKISNTNRSDLSIDFIKEDSLTKEEYEKITAVIKDKKIIKEAVNAKRYKPSKIIAILRRYFKLDDKIKFNASYHHTQLTKYYKIKPLNDEDPFDTNTKYCLYDDTHKDYVYTKEWIEFLKNVLSPNPLEKFNHIKEELIK